MGPQKIVEEDLCGFAALVMMPLDQTVLYTTHCPGPLAAEIYGGPVHDRRVHPTLRPRRLIVPLAPLSTMRRSWGP